MAMVIAIYGHEYCHDYGKYGHDHCHVWPLSLAIYGPFIIAIIICHLWPLVFARMAISIAMYGHAISIAIYGH